MTFGIHESLITQSLANKLKKLPEKEFSKPMSITWKLEEPIPEYLWTASAKMAVG